VFDDVTELPGYTKMPYAFGNQVWGMPESAPKCPDPIVVLEKFYCGIAELHAKYWKDPELKKESSSWIRFSEWGSLSLIKSSRNRVKWELAMEYARDSWNRAKSNPGAILDPKLSQVVDNSLRLSNWSEVQKQIERQPWTLTHGDFHAGNALLNVDLKAVPLIYMCDWSEFSIWEPTADLAQTIVSDVKPSVFIGATKELVASYYSTLVKLNPSIAEQGYTFEECWASYCRSGAEKWIWLLALMAGHPKMPPVAVQYFHDQVKFFVENHNPQDVYLIKSLVPIVA
jgi:hypothetical protein